MRTPSLPRLLLWVRGGYQSQLSTSLVGEPYPNQLDQRKALVRVALAE
jgi:hypothetical protein